MLTVTTPDGEYLASSGDDIPDPDTFRLLSPTATSFDPWVVVETPEGTDELHVTVEDLVGRGGPRFGYRLTATANGPDFELRLSTAQLTLNSGASKPIEVGAARRGYLGPIRLYVEEAPAGIEARDGWITREVRDLDTRTLARSGRILVTADLDAPRRRFDLEIRGEAVLEDGTVIRRRATVPGSVTAGPRRRRSQLHDGGRAIVQGPLAGESLAGPAHRAAWSAAGRPGARDGEAGQGHAVRLRVEVRGATG